MLSWIWRIIVLVLLVFIFAYMRDLSRRAAFIFHDESMRETLERHEKEIGELKEAAGQE